MTDGPLPQAQAKALAAGLHEHHPVGNPYAVPPERRYESDADDPQSVANPEGDDLSNVDPEDGEPIDPALFW